MRWLQGLHPDEPDNWRTSVRDTEKRVDRWAKRKRQNNQREETIFPDLWTVHKVAFSRAQHRKCGYCELDIAADPNGGDIEHYRPKARITRLLDDPATWGREIDGHNSRDPRFSRRAPHVCRGYFWLAYTWTNYLLACGTCNQKWKGNLFPIQGGHKTAPTPESIATEQPLLLNPYGDMDPAEHLEFHETGLITARNDSPFGFETIRTCCLTRESLRSHRERFAKEACLFIQRIDHELAQDPWNERKLRLHIGRLLRLGNRKAPHSGMVQILWTQRNGSGLTWNQLKTFYQGLRSAKP